MKLPDIIEVTLKVVRVFEEMGIEYHVGGSLASSAFGIARSTLDVDIVADIRHEQATLLYESLKEEFYIDIDMIRDAINRRSSFNLIHLETMFKVDVFIPKNRPFDRQAFIRRIQKPVSAEDPSQQLFFATPEDTILNKLEWYKGGGEVSERQWKDVIGVLKVQREGLDISYLKSWAKELKVYSLLEKALKETEVSY